MRVHLESKNKQKASSTHETFVLPKFYKTKILKWLQTSKLNLTGPSNQFHLYKQAKSFNFKANDTLTERRFCGLVTLTTLSSRPSPGPTATERCFSVLRDDRLSCVNTFCVSSLLLIASYLVSPETTEEMLNCWDASDTHHRVSAGWSYCKKVWGCRCNCSSTPTAESLFRWEQHNVTNWRPLSRHWGEVLAVEGETQSRWGISLSLSPTCWSVRTRAQKALWGSPCLTVSVLDGVQVLLYKIEMRLTQVTREASHVSFVLLQAGDNEAVARILDSKWFAKKKKEKNGRPINQTGNRG